MYDYSYYGTNAISDVDVMESALELVTGTAIFTLGISLAVTILMIVSYWKMFKKAGQPGWAAIIPIYNMVVMFKVGKLNPWLILLYLIPFVNIVLSIVLSVNIAKAFGKGSGYAIGLVLLPVIFYPMLAFGKSEYQA